MPVLNPHGLVSNRVEVIQAFHNPYKGVQIPRAELDLSGGVDSAVMLGILTRALGPENVTTIHLNINSNPVGLERARECATAFGAKLIEFDGTELFNSLLDRMTAAMEAAGYSKTEIAARCERDPTIMGSIRSTLRAPWGRAANRLTGGGIRHGTGNEDEDRILRFFQKGGDGEVDTNPIAMLSKGEVYQLALALGVPRSIIEARPSPDLWGSGDAHNDEEEIANYLGLRGCGIPMYSYVDPTTGQYKNVGLIERLSRWCDERKNELFQDNLSLDGLRTLIEDVAVFDHEWIGLPEVSRIVPVLLNNARRIECNTRHKMNPNCPSLGNRTDLINLDLITNTLPL